MILTGSNPYLHLYRRFLIQCDVMAHSLHCSMGSWLIPSWRCTFYLLQSPHRPWDPCSVQSAVWPQSLSHSPDNIPHLGLKMKINPVCASIMYLYIMYNCIHERMGFSYLVIYWSARAGLHLYVWFGSMRHLRCQNMKYTKCIMQLTHVHSSHMIDRTSLASCSIHWW